MTEKQRKNQVKMAAEKIKVEKKRLKNRSILIKKLLVSKIVGLGKFRPLKKDDLFELQKLLEPVCNWLSLQWINQGGVANYRYNPKVMEW